MGLTSSTTSGLLAGLLLVGGVLVICQQGAHRSALAAAGIVVGVADATWSEAADHIRAPTILTTRDMYIVTCNVYPMIESKPQHIVLNCTNKP